ncbi:hypothetical protein KAX17_18575, partial [Candidatus Bipolaricaulota bacterium]|nr:hypothetical protein [Candidatus Bipolaricaulota bacterium]
HHPSPITLYSSLIALAITVAIVGTIISVLVLAGRGEVDVGPWTMDHGLCKFNKRGELIWL